MSDEDSKINQIDATYLKSYQIQNFNNNEQLADVVPLSKDFPLSDQNIAEIVEACNQEDIYSLLFKDLFGENGYNEDNAKWFESWANEGWQNQSYFVYLIKTDDNKIIGAIDIRSNEAEFAEIGYWMDKNYPGYMTNALIGLIDKAKQAGYRNLIAYTKLENDKSKRVLTRAGFEYVGQEEKKQDKVRDKFIININNHIYG